MGIFHSNNRLVDSEKYILYLKNSNMKKTIFICIIATIISLIVLCLYGGIGTSLGIAFLKKIQQNNMNKSDKKIVTSDTDIINYTEVEDSLNAEVIEVENTDYIRTKLHESQYYHYYNSRFGYGIAYPSCFIQQEESTNGDGCNFYMNEKIYLSVFASYNVLNETLADKYYKNDISSITYSKLKNNWFVISDYTSDGRVFYQKTVLKDSIFITAILCYPPEYKNDFQEITQKIFSNFPN